MKTLEQVKKEIMPEAYYRPREIAENNWMIGYRGKNAYYYILKLIKLGRLRAKDFGLGKTPYYRVLGSDLLRYLETLK